MTANRRFDPTTLTVRQLLAAYVAIIDELLSRGLVRTRNPPLGDLAEHIVWKAYGGTLADNSAKSYDIIDEAGRRVQVKARAIELSDRRTQAFSAIRSWDFEAVVFLNVDSATYDIVWARELTKDEAMSLGRRRELTNSSAISVSAVRALGIDVTEKVRAAYEGLDLRD
jgi:hypothetical protein